MPSCVLPGTPFAVMSPMELALSIPEPQEEMISLAVASSGDAHEKM